MKTPDTKKIKPAPYNPRKINEHQYNGLKTSMDKFGDLSGITWNETTQHLISGHQRWAKLTNDYSDLTLQASHDDKFAIVSKKSGYTGFDMRVVHWDEVTERAANLTANNHAIGGEWETELLHSLLDEIRSHDLVAFKDLRMDILEQDLKLNFDKEWDSDIGGVGGLGETTDGPRGKINIECQLEDKAKVLEFLKNSLAKTFEGISIK